MRSNSTDDDLLDSLKDRDQDWIVRTLAQLLAEMIEEGASPAEVQQAIENLCRRFGIDYADVRRACN